MSGPYETERQAADAAQAYPAGGAANANPNLTILIDACLAAGVRLGRWDARIIESLASTWEPATCAVIAGLISRAHEPVDSAAGAAIDVTASGEIAVVMAGGRAELADPYAFQRALEQAIARRVEIRAPLAEHLGPVAGDD